MKLFTAFIYVVGLEKNKNKRFIKIFVLKIDVNNFSYGFK